jgi:arginyl-tRNA--protein-N-Asp/Glu arginylyltransferase
MSTDDALAALRFYQTAPHKCSYLEDRAAATIFMDPETPLTKPLYSRLIIGGFRRSGDHLYRPACASCQACISSRVRVREFQHSRRFSRVWRRNQDLCVVPLKVLDGPEFFSLYERYINARHRDGDMFPPDQEQYQSFIEAKSATTQFFGFYLADKLVAVCILDEIDHALSAMYNFFDPKLKQRSLGVYLILWQIEKAKRLNLPYLYLGYWIKESPKMQYKTEYRPLELYINDRWVLLN